MPPRRARTPAADPITAISQLIAERDKYDQWLEDLDAKKDATPPKVFERVRQDYLTRLQAVSEQLKEHTGGLREHAANLVAKLRELEASEQETRDNLAEAELRQQVGEITETEWESTQRKAHREIAKTQESQETVADDLNKIREALGDSDEDEDEARAPRTSADFNELEFLKSVVGVTPPTPTMAAPQKPDPKVEATNKPALPPDQAIAAAQKADAPASTPAPTAPTAPTAPAAPAAPAAAAKKTTPLDNEPVADAPKTLKCTECGAMNYGTEWYCERCGAELTVI